MADLSNRLSITAVGLLLLTGVSVYFFFYKTQEPNTVEQSISPLVKSLQPPIQPAENTSSNASQKETIKIGENAAPSAGEQEPDWIKAALKSLDDPDQDISLRLEAVAALRNHPSAKAIELLEMFLADRESILVEEALKTLGVIGLNSDFKNLAFNILAKTAGDKDSSFRGQALRYAAMFGEDDKILPIIGEYLAENTSEFSALAVRAMAIVSSPECVPYLREVLANESDSGTRQNAYQILAKIGTQEADDLLKDSLFSKYGDEQASSAFALSHSQNANHHDMLAEALINDTLEHNALSIIATSRAAGNVFSTAFRSQDVSKDDKLYYLNALADSTISSPGYVRDEVAHMLTNLLNSQDPDIEVAALETLSKVGPTEDLSKALVPKFESNDILVQGAALKAFTQHCTPDNYKHLKTLWDHEDEKIRRTAFVVAELFVNESDMEDLEKAAKSKDEFISSQAKVMINYVAPN